MPNRTIELFKQARPALAAAALLMAAPVAAMAQDAPAAADISQWIKVCNPKQATMCAVTKDYFVESGPNAIATFTISTTADPKKFGVGLSVPPGFIFPPGIPVFVDGNKKVTAQYAVCWPDGPKSSRVMCIAQASVADDFVTALKKGGTVELQLTSGDGKMVPIDFSLAGFSKVFDGADMGQDALVKQRDQIAKLFEQKAQQRGQQLIDAQRKPAGGG